jgi:hypothetical protein
MLRRLTHSGLAAALIGLSNLAVGCHHPSITAVPLSPGNCSEPEGIPFYLPKPLLVIAKNFRNIEEPTVGLTDSAPIPGSFDDQSKYADVNARTSFSTAGAGAQASTYSTATPGTGTSSKPTLHSNGAPVTPGTPNPTDGLTPDTFFTYQIMFVPDMSQKYGLKIKGGVGEIRAAMNLVNGWQFTGLGPFYMKDSSTAQNILASGIASNLALNGVSDVINSFADLRKPGAATPGTPSRAQITPDDLKALNDRIDSVKVTNEVANIDRLHSFAEIHVYEQVLSPEGGTIWREITNPDMKFDRDFLRMKTTREYKLKPAANPAGNQPPPTPNKTAALSPANSSQTKMLLTGESSSAGQAAGEQNQVESITHVGSPNSILVPVNAEEPPVPQPLPERDDQEMNRAIVARTLAASSVLGGRPQATVVGAPAVPLASGAPSTTAAAAPNSVPSVIVMPPPAIACSASPKPHPFLTFFDHVLNHTKPKPRVENVAMVGAPTVETAPPATPVGNMPKVSDPSK